jgi:uncharacterized protein (DUF4415 family)
MRKSASNTVKRTLDLAKKPILTAGQKARLDTVAAMPDEAIDYSDAPWRPDAIWVKPAELPNYKKQITLRIDGDVLDFFRNTGSRYQSRINAVLRTYMDAQKAQPGIRGQ